VFCFQYKGGMHIQSALAGVPPQDLCPQWKKGAVGCAGVK